MLRRSKDQLRLKRDSMRADQDATGAENQLNRLSKQIDDLDRVKQDALQKLAQYQGMIQTGMRNEGAADPALQDQLKKL